jgi:hypothetical protein
VAAVDDPREEGNPWDDDFDEVHTIDITNPRERNDWQALAEYIETGGKITHEMRKFLAAVLRGEEKRPPHRVRSFATVRRQVQIAVFVYGKELAGSSNTEAIKKAVEQFKPIDERTVRRAVSRYSPRLLAGRAVAKRRSPAATSRLK